MLDIKVGAALLGFTLVEQRTILDCVKEGKEAPTSRLREAVAKVTEIIDTHEEVVEGYAGFPIDKSVIDKNKNTFKDDRNIGRVISQGGQSMVITGKKADGRYQVVGKKGEKTAKAPEDIGLNMQREHIDIDDLHQQMVEGLKQARKNVGASTCWDGYKAKGTKKKGGKEVPNCVKEEDQIDERYKGKHGQSSAEYKDDRSQGGKMVSGDSKMSGAEYTHGRRVKAANPGSQPDEGGKTKPKSQGKMDKGTRADLQYRKANLKKEDVQSLDEKKKGLWANIHAKRKRGERAARPGEKDYPKTLNVESNGLKTFKQFVEGAAWTKKSGKSESGGLNEKGRKSYERENPGSDLKAPSKKVGNPRRASFCARMKGMKKKLTSKKTANDKDSRINKSLRAWNC